MEIAMTDAALTAFTPARRNGRGARSGFSAMIRGLARAFTLSIEKSGQRRVLARLDDDALRDIGISRSDAAREAAKPFWR